MSKERDLLARVLESRTFMQGVALRREIEKLLAQPEQEPVYWENEKKALLNEIDHLTNRLAQPEQTEQEPVAWCQMVEGKVQDLLTSFEMKDWLYDKSWIPLYTSPPKREHLSEATIEHYLERLGSDFKWDDGFEAGVKWAEKAHGITE